jgi:tetratricopeptide (TPR) repeat protein
MRSDRHVTAVMLLSAFTTIGCSKPFGSPQTNAKESRDSAQAKPTAAPRSLDRNDEEGFGEEPAVKVTGPVSFAEADAAFQAKNYGEAAKLFERYTAQRPGNAWGHFMLGLSMWKSGDLVKAEDAFEKALSVDPHHVKSLVNLSRVLIDQNRVDDAVVKLTQAADIDPNSGEVQRLLGRAYCADGKTEEGVDAYRRAIALDARDAWSMNNLGLVFFEQGRIADALPLLAKAVELRADVPEFHNNLGMALEHTGRFGAAAAEYRDALTADSGYAKAQRNLSRVEAVKVDHEEPFDLEATAEHSVESPKIPSDATTAGR